MTPEQEAVTALAAGLMWAGTNALPGATALEVARRCGSAAEVERLADWYCRFAAALDAQVLFKAAGDT